MSRKTTAVAGGDTGTIEQYNKLRDEAEGSSRLLAREQGTPDLTLYVSEGNLYFNGSLVSFAGGNSPSFTAPATNPRIDVLSINSSGTLVRTAGAEAGSPTAPSVPTGNIPICQVYNRVGQSSIKEASDGSNGYIYKDTRPFIQTAGGSVIISAIAEEDLVAGNPVGVSFLKDGYIARAKRNTSSNAHGVSSQINTMPRHADTQRCPIGGNKFAYLLHNSGGTGTLFAQIGSLDPDTKTVTLGTALAVTATLTPANNFLTNACIAKVDTDKFIVFYVNDASATVIKYRVGTVSGTTITFGSEATASTAGSTVATSNCFLAEYISAGKGVFAFFPATTTNARVVGFTVSGTVATFGSEQTMGTNTVASESTKHIAKIATDKFVIVSNNGQWAQVFTMSGTTITAGTEAQISSSASGTQSSDMPYVVSHITDGFLVRFCSNGSSNFAVVACTVSGTTITSGTTVIPSATLSSSYHGGIYVVSATEFWVTGGISAFYIHKFTLSGTTITEGSRISFASSGQGTWAEFMLDSGIFIVADWNATTTYVWIVGMSNCFNGFAQATVNAGETVSVLLKGKDANQSGLLAGANYLVDQGALSLVTSTVTVNSLDDLDVVKALSATEILV